MKNNPHCTKIHRDSWKDFSHISKKKIKLKFLLVDNLILNVTRECPGQNLWALPRKQIPLLIWIHFLSCKYISTDVSACLSVRLPVFHTRHKGLKTFFSICCDLHNLSSLSSVPCVGYTIKEILADSIYMSHHLSNNYLASPGSIVR